MKTQLHTIAYVKRQAKNLKKQRGISHTEALDLISKEHGYSNWKHYNSFFQQQSKSKIKTVVEVTHITFTDWLKRHKNRNSPLGDLSTDMLRDKEWPLYDSLKNYQTYLHIKQASFAAVETLKRAWKSYKGYLKRRDTLKSSNLKHSKILPKNYDARKIVFVSNARPLHYSKRSAEKFNSGDKAWISWNGRKAIPVTILEVDDRYYTFRIERPLKNAGDTHFLYLDEVRSNPELACQNYITL